MNWKNFLGGTLVGVALTLGTLAWAHAERGDSRDNGMGMMGMMSQMQGMMNRCNAMMDRMMNEEHGHGMDSDATSATDDESGIADDYR